MQSERIPILIGSYRTYNFVQYGSMFYIIPQALGPIDLNNEQHRNHPDILRTTNKEELEKQVDEYGSWYKFDPLYSPTPLTEFGLPEVIEIEPIYTCNLRCIMCHVSYENPTKELIDVNFVQKLKGLKGKWAKLGSLYEPVAHPRFAEIVQGLSEIGMRIDLVTNGTLFTPSLISEIADCNFQNVTVSFDGIRKETYEKIRRRGNFEQSIERIRAFKDAIKSRNPKAFFMINYTMMRSNIEEIVEAVDFWEKNGFDHIGFIAMTLRDQNELLLNENIAPIMDRVEELLDVAALRVIDGHYRISLTSPFYRASSLREKYPNSFKLLSDGLVISDNPKARTPCSPGPHFQNGSFPEMQVACRSPFKFVRISYQGNVNLCYKFKIGKIYDNDLLALWYGAEAEKVRNLVRSTTAICNKCEYFLYCIQANDINYENSDNLISRNKIEFITEIGPFNILRWMGSYYSVPQWVEVSAPLTELPAHGIFDGASIEEIKSHIASIAPPHHVETIGMFDVIEWLGAYFGIPHRITPVDLKVRYPIPGVVMRRSLGELHQLLSFAPEPLLVDALSGFNIVMWQDRYFVLPQNAGAIDVCTDDIGVIGGCVCKSYKEALDCVRDKSSLFQKIVHKLL